MFPQKLTPLKSIKKDPFLHRLFSAVLRLSFTSNVPATWLDMRSKHRFSVCFCSTFHVSDAIFGYESIITYTSRLAHTQWRLWANGHAVESMLGHVLYTSGLDLILQYDTRSPGALMLCLTKWQPMTT